MREQTSGARGGSRSGGSRGGPGGGMRSDRPMRERSGGSRFLRKKTCRLCAEVSVDYKDRDRLLRYLTEKGKIIPRRTTGNCSKCQGRLVNAIKRARHAGILAFSIESL